MSQLKSASIACHAFSRCCIRGSRVAVDEMNFYLQSFAAKYAVHTAMPFVIENNEDVVLLADAWLDVSSDSHKHAKVVSAMLVGGHWTPIMSSALMTSTRFIQIQ